MKMRYLITPIILAAALLLASGCSEDENGNRVDISKLPGKWSIITAVYNINFFGTPATQTDTYPYNFYTLEFDGTDSVTAIVVDEGFWDRASYSTTDNTISISEEAFGIDVDFTLTRLTDNELIGSTSFNDLGVTGTIQISGIRNDGREATITSGDLVGSWNITQFDTYKNDTLQTSGPDDPIGEDITFQIDGSGFIGDAVNGTLIAYGLIDASNIGLRTDTNDDGLLTDEIDELWHVIGFNNNNLGLVSYEIDDSTDPVTIYRYDVTLVKN